MTRSENMAKVKNKNTGPEIYLRKLLWKSGLRYRKNYKKLEGTPDIYIPKYKTAIFVNGCFWHVHKNCKFFSIPKTNQNFWLKKFKTNAERDFKNYSELENKGITVIIVWGCEIKKMMKDPEFKLFKIKSLISEIVSKKQNV